MIPTVKISDSSSENNDEESEENVFDNDINEEIEVTPKTTINAKVVCTMKKLQALCNDDTSKIVAHAAQEKGANEN